MPDSPPPWLVRQRRSSHLTVAALERIMLMTEALRREGVLAGQDTVMDAALRSVTIDQVRDQLQEDVSDWSDWNRK